MSREAVARWRSRLLAAGSTGKAAMGVLLVAVGVLILTGLDKRLEARAYTREAGDDLPEIRDWSWSGAAGVTAADSAAGASD